MDEAALAGSNPFGKAPNIETAVGEEVSTLPGIEPPGESTDVLAARCAHQAALAVPDTCDKISLVDGTRRPHLSSPAVEADTLDTSPLGHRHTRAGDDANERNHQGRGPEARKRLTPWSPWTRS
jgi:hypothetical protein